MSKTLHVGSKLVNGYCKFQRNVSLVMILIQKMQHHVFY